MALPSLPVPRAPNSQQAAMVMSLFQLRALDAKIAKARKLVAEQQWRVRARDHLDGVAKSRELLHDLTYWLRNLEAHRETLLRQSRLDRAENAGQRHARRARSNAA
jgi:hypothetical protein